MAKKDEPKTEFSLEERIKIYEKALLYLTIQARFCMCDSEESMITLKLSPSGLCEYFNDVLSLQIETGNGNSSENHMIKVFPELWNASQRIKDKHYKGVVFLAYPGSAIRLQWLAHAIVDAKENLRLDSLSSKYDYWDGDDSCNE